MKKQINLYQPSCYPKREKATFKQFLLLSGTCGVAVIALLFILNNRLLNTQENTQRHKSLLVEKKSELKKLTAALNKNRVPPLKTREQQDLQEEISAKRRLLASLSGMDSMVSVSFSQLMRGLSSADTSAISISSFSTVDGRLNITGKAQYSDSVALWLAKVQMTPELSGISFEQLAMSDSDDAEQFSFKLINSVKNEPVKAQSND